MSRRRAAAGPVAAALLTALLATACAPADSDYFGPNEPAWVRVPVALGDPVYVGVILLTARPGDTVTIETVDFGEVDGDAQIQPLASILHGRTRLIGASTESQLLPDIELPSYQPAAGIRFGEGDGPVALAARITGTTPIHGFRSVTVRFRTDGVPGVHVDLIRYRATVCTAATFAAAVEVCRPIADAMSSFGP